MTIRRNKMFYLGVEWIVLSFIMYLQNYLIFNASSIGRDFSIQKLFLFVIIKKYFYTVDAFIFGVLILYISVFYNIEKSRIIKTLVVPIAASIVPVIAIIVMYWNRTGFEYTNLFEIIVFTILLYRLIRYLKNKDNEYASPRKLFHKLVVFLIILVQVLLSLHTLYRAVNGLKSAEKNSILIWESK